MTARFLTSVFTILILTAPVPSAPVPKDDKLKPEAAELKKLEGTWEVESATLFGRPLPQTDPPVRYEIKGSTTTVVATKQLWTFTLDLTKNPKRMTQSEAELKNGNPVPTAAGQVNLCVYSLDGDKLTTVIARSGPNGENLGIKGDFPKSLPPEPGDPILVITYKRVKN